MIFLTTAVAVNHSYKLIYLLTHSIFSGLDSHIIVDKYIFWYFAIIFPTNSWTNCIVGINISNGIDTLRLNI